LEVGIVHSEGRWAYRGERLEWYYCFADWKWNIIEALRRSKGVVHDCRGWTSPLRREFVMAPRAYLKKKRTNQNGNRNRRVEIDAGKKALENKAVDTATAGTAPTPADDAVVARVVDQKWQHYKPEDQYTNMIPEGHTRNEKGEFVRAPGLQRSVKRLVDPEDDATDDYARQTKRPRRQNEDQAYPD